MFTNFQRETLADLPERHRARFAARLTAAYLPQLHDFIERASSEDAPRDEVEYWATKAQTVLRDMAEPLGAALPPVPEREA